jgi:hypothetical protein
MASPVFSKKIEPMEHTHHCSELHAVFRPLGIFYSKLKWDNIDGWCMMANDEKIKYYDGGLDAQYYDCVSPRVRGYTRCPCCLVTLEIINDVEIT